MSEKSNITRRELFAGAGIFAMGTAFAQLGGLTSSAEAKGGSTEKWPWPYVKLDPEKTAELAYNEWYRIFCGGAVISSIFTQLRKKVGKPYTYFPIDAFIYLEGGNVGWGTICGSTAGASLVSNVIIGPRSAGIDEGHEIADEMLEWYSEIAMPVYTPKDPKVKTEIVKTVAESPLCHASVGRWMKASGYHISSPERRDRCARVTASVAYQTVVLLNAWKDRKYESKATWTPISSFGISSQQNCMSCHSSDIPTPPLKK